MSRDHGPLKKWMLANGYGNPDTGVVSGDDCTRFAEGMTAATGHKIAGETIRFLAHGYRLPTWEQAIDIELFTVGGVCAVEMREGSAA
jgi:hypothetical protein